jgi:hypothetical protein
MTGDGVIITEAEAQQAREFKSVLYDLIVLEEACEVALHEYAVQIGRQAAMQLDALIMGEAETQKGKTDDS